MILVAIGANLPGKAGESPLATCVAAAHALATLPGLRLAAVSRWYLSAPVPPSAQPDYVNGMARLEPAAPGASLAAAPAALLAALQAIERRFGRRRGAPNAARTLDLDLIDANGAIVDTPRLVLPHPRAHLRAFVLLPLLDVAPDWRHPALRLTARDLADRVDRSGVRAMAD